MMSAPVHRDDQTDDLQFYAPPRARVRPSLLVPDQPCAEDAPPTASDSGDAEVTPHPPEATESPPTAPPAREAQADAYERSPASARPQATASPRMAPGLGGPNIDRTSRRRAFEGDVAIQALRERMSLDPEFLPAPPVRARPRARAILPWLGWVSVLAGVATVVAFGITVVTWPEPRPTATKADKAGSPVIAPQPAGPQLAGMSTPIPPPRLAVEGRQAFANEALPLGISFQRATGGEFALLTGLVAGTRISAGDPFGANGWRLPARDLGHALAHAPKDFVGVMDAAVDVHADNDALVDSRLVRLEWLPRQVDGPGKQPRLDREDPLPPAAAMPSLDAEELATLIRRGQDYLRIGDIAAARLVLRRAANAGNPQAALALGATFDPLVLADLGVLGFPSDLTQARSWYDKAARLGSAEALRRIEALAHAGQ
jgi:hypothetical protein